MPNDYISVKLLRPQDLLSLELRFKNFTLSGNKLIKKADPALMMVLFQSQSIAEECGIEDSKGRLHPPADHPIKLLISGDSRLVFKVNKNSLSLDVNDLLNWDNFELVVNSRAKGIQHIVQPVIIKIDKLLANPGSSRNIDVKNIKGLTKDDRLYLKQQLTSGESKPTQKAALLDQDGIITALDGIITTLFDEVAPPADWETSLEIPFRLFLSPTITAGWKHLIKLNSTKGIIKDADKLYELWHTRMGTKTSYGIDDSDLTFEERLLRILWGEKIDTNYKNIPSVPPPPPDDTFLTNTSINDKDRHELVHESSNFEIGFTPQPVRAHKLFLTTLGASLDSIFEVDKKLIPADNPLGLLKWRHIQTLAREHYVEIVHEGNIMCPGHETVVFTITERKPHSQTVTATNFKRTVAVTTQPVKYYNYRDKNGHFMDFCFRKIEMITTVTPLLDDIKTPLVSTLPVPAEEQFLIRSGGQDVQFKMRGEDFDGNIVNFQMPLVFIGKRVLSNATYLKQVIDAYNALPEVKRSTNFNGQKVSLAPPETNACDTAYSSFEASFKVMQYSGADELQGFLPNLGKTNIIEPSYQRLTGADAKVYVSLEDDNNAGHVFATFNDSNPVDFAGHADKTGGFAMPNFRLSGLSKAAGAFGGKVADFSNAATNAAGYFKVGGMPDPVLFGVFKLSDILEFPSGDTSSYDLSKPLLNRAPKIPNLTTEETGSKIITSYLINPKLKYWRFPDPKTGLPSVVDFNPDSPDGFSITTQVITNKNNPADPPSFSTEAKMGGFTIGIMDDLINVKFDHFIFTASPGKSADVNIKMQNPSLDFGGPLSFINVFQKLIPPEGFSDPPYLDVSKTGVKCGYTLAIPDLQLGAFTLAHLALGAEVNLPFTGGPLVMGFRFCEKQQPFTLTISCLGGGGYLGFEASLHGLMQIEVALEFGAAVALNLGVASGSVSIMAGIYFKTTLAPDNVNNTTDLAGYLRINGAMSILGLISAAVELYIAFHYSPPGKAWGEATISIRIHIVFTKSVSVHASRTFAGSGSDPNFQLTYTPERWREYCEAFAA